MRVSPRAWRLEGGVASVAAANNKWNGYTLNIRPWDGGQKKKCGLWNVELTDEGTKG